MKNIFKSNKSYSGQVISTSKVVNLTSKVVILTPKVVDLTFKVVILTPKWSIWPLKWSFWPRKWSIWPPKWSFWPRKWSIWPPKWSFWLFDLQSGHFYPESGYFDFKMVNLTYFIYTHFWSLFNLNIPPPPGLLKSNY